MFTIKGKYGGYHIYKDVYYPSIISVKKDETQKQNKIVKSNGILPEHYMNALIDKATKYEK